MRRVLAAVVLLVVLSTTLVSAAPSVVSSVWVSRGEATLTLNVSRQSGWYRFKLRSSDGQARNSFIIEFQTGDPEVHYYGRIRETRQTRNGTELRRSTNIEYRYDGSTPAVEICSDAVGACFSTDSIVFQRKRATIVIDQLIRKRTYEFIGSAKIARQAYVYGKWIRNPVLKFRA